MDPLRIPLLRIMISHLLMIFIGETGKPLELMGMFNPLAWLVTQFIEDFEKPFIGGKLWETYQLKIVPSRTFEGELPVKTSMQRPDHGMLFSLRCRQLLAATTSRRHVAVACHGTPYVLHNILTYSDICKEDLAPIINIPEKIDI